MGIAAVNISETEGIILGGMGQGKQSVDTKILTTF
jgi:hypothetical protein